MEISIPTLVRKTMTCYDPTRSRMSESRPTGTLEKDIGLWDDQMGRLRLWAGNIGAHQSGRSSLETRLKDASDIKEQIVGLLTDICDLFSEADAILRDNPANNQTVEISQISQAEDEADNMTDDLMDLLETLRACVNGLFTMSLLVRRPVKHDFLKAIPTQEITAFEPFDKDHVRNKFPKASKVLVERLGLAITRRRHYLRYRACHRSRLTARLDDNDETGTLSDIMVTAFAQKRSEQDIQPESSDATTILLRGAITMPLIPNSAGLGTPFICPYCFVMICVDDQRQWEEHVFQDLQPYMCMIEKCPTPTAMYASRREWTNHVKTMHGSGWLQQNAMGHRIAENIQCPLCAFYFFTEFEMVDHLAKHLQELALFVLPRPDDEKDEGTQFVDLNADRQFLITGQIAEAKVTSWNRRTPWNEASPITEDGSDLKHQVVTDVEGLPGQPSIFGGRRRPTERRRPFTLHRLPTTGNTRKFHACKVHHRKKIQCPQEYERGCVEWDGDELDLPEWRRGPREPEDSINIPIKSLLTDVAETPIDMKHVEEEVPLGARMTRIESGLYDTAKLKRTEVPFEEFEDHVVVDQALSRDEIEDIAPDGVKVPRQSGRGMDWNVDDFQREGHSKSRGGDDGGR